MTGWPRALALACGAAALLIAAHEPFGLAPLAFVALMPLVLLARSNATPRTRYGAAYAGGLLLFGGGCSWLVETHVLNLVLMTLPEALVVPLFVASLRAVVRRVRVPLWFAVAALWTGLEFARAHVPFNGFPWLLLGATQVHPLAMAQAADLAGTTGLTFAVAAANGLFAAALQREGRARWLRTGAALAIPLLLYGYGTARLAALATDGREGPRVALIQANIPQRLKHRTHSDRDIFMRQSELTARAVAQAAPDGFDLACWAETMFTPALGDGDPGDVWFRTADGTIGPPDARNLERIRIEQGIVGQLLGPIGASFLIGVPAYAGRSPEEVTRKNAVYLYDAHGERTATYAKTLLVPGGEFIPLRRFLPDVVDAIVLGMAGFLPDLVPGDGPVPFVLETRGRGAFTFATTVCYENTYAGYVARAARGGVDFLVNLSNEGWFGASREFDQMDAASRLRAIETRRSLVRVTNTGISAVYDAAGRRRATLVGPDGRDRAVEGVLLADVPICVAWSPFVASGDVAGVASCAAAAVLVGMAALRRYRNAGHA